GGVIVAIGTEAAGGGEPIAVGGSRQNGRDDKTEDKLIQSFHSIFVFQPVMRIGWSKPLNYFLANRTLAAKDSFRQAMPIWKGKMEKETESLLTTPATTEGGAAPARWEKGGGASFMGICLLGHLVRMDSLCV